MMNLKKAVLKGFNSGNYTATIQLAGSRKAYLEGVAVTFFDEHNAKEAVVIAVYS